MATTAELVSNGVALLDAQMSNWRSHVNVKELDMSHTERCVLGQIFGSYRYGESCLSIDGSKYGFNVSYNGSRRASNYYNDYYYYFRYDRRNFRKLQAEWVRVLTAAPVTDPAQTCAVPAERVLVDAGSPR